MYLLRKPRSSTLPVPFAILVAMLLSLALFPARAQAIDEAGVVVFTRGVVTAQQDGKPPRVVSGKDVLLQRDTLRVGARSFAVIRLADGSRMTLRPNTVLKLDRIETAAGKEEGVLSLLKGGMRTITGFIGKRRPGSYTVRTPVAAIGIRGTEFDARLCDGNCDTDSNGDSARAVSPLLAPVGRVVLMRGTAHIIDSEQRRRKLTRGGPLYPGDSVETGSHAFAVIAFRDQTRVTIQPRSRFRISAYRYTPQRDDPADSVVMRLVKGGLRIATGLLAKRRPGAVSIRTPLTTIGIRGTGLDLYCGSGCAEDTQDTTGMPAGLNTHVWLGAVALQLASTEFPIRQGETWQLASATAKPVRLPELPRFMRDAPAPRPDTVDVDYQQQFGTRADASTSRPGLYVAVTDGHIVLTQDDKRLDIGGGEVGWAGDNRLERLSVIPGFIADDPYPSPDEVDEGMQRIIELISNEPGSAPECSL